LIIALAAAISFFGGTTSWISPIALARDGVRLALRHHLQRVLLVGQARHALGAAGAREDADLDLGQRHLDRFAVGGDAAVAGERQFERAAHAGAVDRRHPRLAAGFQLAVEPAHPADAVEQHLHRFLRVVAPFRSG
jgi:hypothetical protein